MKRAITQKVKPVPSCEMESTNLKEGQTRSALLNADRRARTSAAMNSFREMARQSKIKIVR